MRQQSGRRMASRGGHLPRRRVRASRDRDSITRDRRNGVTYRVITDNQGSVRLVVNAETSEVAQRLDYDSFGRVINDTNPGFQPFGFQGGLYDPDTGLVEFGCRWYDAETGRWISKDPILLDGGWNVYAFCGGDSLNLFDPDGCAMIKTRPLDSGSYGTYSLLSTWAFSRINLPGDIDVRHREIFFEDGLDSKECPSHIGYGPIDGGVHKDVSPLMYNNQELKHYNDKLMREAVLLVKNTGEWSAERYNLFAHNCQDFVTAVIREYEKLEKKAGK